MNSRIKITKESRERTVRAPLNRRLWYLFTLGKYGDLFHKHHYTVNVFYASIDNKIKYVHSLLDGDIDSTKYQSDRFTEKAFINCRCSIDKTIKAELSKYQH